MNTSIRFPYFFIPIFIIFCFVFGLLSSVMNNYWVDFSVLERYNPGKPSVLLDDEGNIWEKFELDRRQPVKLDQMPTHLIHAFMAAEDRDFFKHSGLSWKGIARSTLVNLRYGRIVQGASTITQQLVKLLFFDSKRTFKRKIKEQFFSLLVEKQFTKGQILQTYLNHVYFGCGIYGVEAASQRFFGKTVKDISISEAAALAAVVRSPGNYCPLLCPLSCQKRRNLILKLMHKLNYINDQEYNEAQSKAIEIYVNEKSGLAPHLKETIRIFLEDLVGRQKLYSGGLKIQTTLNQNTQHIAEDQFKKHFNRLKKELTEKIDGALITIDSQNGEIKALIGGIDFNKSQFNRALQARRQMGSIFKPIVYAAAIQDGKSFADTDFDEPFELNMNGNIWRPRNNTRKFDGIMTLARALSYSNNIITIKILLNAGIPKVIELAKKCRLPDNMSVYPSLALGCVDVTLKEAIGAFNVFVNHGIYVEPHFIKWIKDDLGVKFWKYSPDSEQVLNSNISGKVVKVLSIGIQRYLKRMNNQNFKSEAMGKTGTTNDSRTCWFGGATPELTTVIYVGRDDNQPLGKDIYAVWSAFPIWLGMHEKLSINKTKFTYDPSLKEIFINWKTGEFSNDLSNSEIVGIYI